MLFFGIQGFNLGFRVLGFRLFGFLDFRFCKVKHVKRYAGSNAGKRGVCSDVTCFTSAWFYSFAFLGESSHANPHTVDPQSERAPALPGQS